jgi:hypothetical protein
VSAMQSRACLMSVTLSQRAPDRVVTHSSGERGGMSPGRFQQAKRFLKVCIRVVVSMWAVTVIQSRINFYKSRERKWKESRLDDGSGMARRRRLPGSVVCRAHEPTEAIPVDRAACSLAVELRGASIIVAAEILLTV